IDEDADKQNKKPFVDFKCVVWHESFYEIVKSLENHAAMGCSIVCGDGIEHLVCPVILILSADYEEQYMFSSSCSSFVM
ncbi:hypothetical protein BKA70DRAFT_1059513, partial [Coprinopsis sp. MPI-PUGE-AT-0042]